MKSIKILALPVLLIFISSCSKDENETPVLRQKNIFEQVSSSMDYSYLTYALQKTNLDVVLSGEDDYTLYAPDNSAFIGFLMRQGFSSLEEVPTDALKQLLFNHVMVGENVAVILNQVIFKLLPALM